jgi:ABC-type proline/glycine betaine transport system ATPase subunit
LNKDWVFFPNQVVEERLMFLLKLSCWRKINISSKVKLLKKDWCFFQSCCGRKIDVSSQVKLRKEDGYFFQSKAVEERL